MGLSRRWFDFGYLDSGPTAPNGIDELMPGAQAIIDFLRVEADERVLILTEHVVDPVGIQATAAAAAYRGADVHVLSVARLRRRRLRSRGALAASAGDLPGGRRSGVVRLVAGGP